MSFKKPSDYKTVGSFGGRTAASDLSEQSETPPTVFVWRKKLEKEGNANSIDEVRRANERKRAENLEELEKVKVRRAEYEQVRLVREQERLRMQRERENAQFQKWSEEEEEFHLKQALLRSEIRIRDGRAKPIDLLAKYINSNSFETLGIALQEPYKYIDECEKEEDLEDLLVDIRTYRHLDQGANKQYWDDIKLLSEEAVDRLRRINANAPRSRDPVNRAVLGEVSSILRDKTTSQLEALRAQIEETLRSGGKNIDVAYWETMLSRLKAHMARQRLKEQHKLRMRQTLHELKHEQGLTDDDQKQSTDAAFDLAVKTEPSSVSEAVSSTIPAPVEPAVIAEVVENDFNIWGHAFEESEKEEIQLYRQRCYTPELIDASELSIEHDVVEETDDATRLRLSREQVQRTGSGRLVSTEDAAFEREAEKGMDPLEEARFSVEVGVGGPQQYIWSEKYRPRKPRYFNRVHTGFEWNKYNQTHYDIDNPPPKIVQGYKFNIFYPDLIDPMNTPKFTVVPCADNKDFAVLRIASGPPYEDIAFKIVSREWEFSHRRGYRCNFHNKIFQLWFHFKKHRYRR